MIPNPVEVAQLAINYAHMARHIAEQETIDTPLANQSWAECERAEKSAQQRTREALAWFDGNQAVQFNMDMPAQVSDQEGDENKS